jgi:hypothetical protein
LFYIFAGADVRPRATLTLYRTLRNTVATAWLRRKRRML